MPRQGLIMEPKKHAVRTASDHRRMVEAPSRLPGKILVADDDACWVELVSGWLSVAGYHVISTRDQSEVPELATAERPDCIVLDYQWSDCTASQLIETLQGDLATRVIPIVVLTGVESVKLPVLLKGADHFVAKDGKSEALLAAVHVSVRRRAIDRGVLVRGELTLDPEGHIVTRSGLTIARLTGPQFAIFYSLVHAAPKPVPRAKLYQTVDPNRSAEGSHALEQLIQRLKSRLPPDLAAQIIVVRDHGWLFRAA